MPRLLVDGVGAVVLPVPPLAAVYHLIDVPVAESAVGVASIQKFTGVEKVGFAGIALIVTTILERGPSQEKPELWLT